MIRPGTSLKQGQPRHQNTAKAESAAVQIPKFEDFLAKSDWVGAGSILELEPQGSRENSELWRAYCAFHNGEYRKAQGIYDESLKKSKTDKMLQTNRALCRYALGQFEEAKTEALKAGDNPLSNRLLYLIAQKKGDESLLMSCHAKLTDSAPDQLAIAAVHCLRGNYDDSIEVYKRLAAQNKRYHALNVYIALCYYRQEYYEISAETVGSYLELYPDSVFANNLAACNAYQLRSGRDGEEELRRLEKRYEEGSLWEDQDLLRHNLAVFRQGENALKIFPPLAESFPEARLNLAISHLRAQDFDQAFKKLIDFEPSNPRETALKAVALAAYAQRKGLSDVQAKGQKLFQTVGTSPNECDTVLGRQCISSFLMLKGQYDDALVYLRTIKEFMAGDDDFNWNYGMALAATGKFAEAEEALLAVRAETYRAEFAYVAWLARCHIMNGRPQLAWNLYLDMDTSNETLSLLGLIANESFRQESYFISFKAFDILERLENEDHSAGKLAAAMGVYKDYLLGKGGVGIEQMGEMLQILRAAQVQKYDEVARVIEEDLKE